MIRTKITKVERHEKDVLVRITFIISLILLIISFIYLYDIVFVAMEVENDSAEQEIIMADLEYNSYVVEEPLNIVVSDKSYFLTHLSADGKYYTYSYSEGDGNTVWDLLTRCSVFINENDYVNYSTDTLLQPDMYVEVGRVTYEDYVQKIDIPFETVEIPLVYAKNYSTKFNDIPGIPGVKEIKQRRKYIDGKLVQTTVINEKIASKPVSATKYVDKSGTLLNEGNGAPVNSIAVLDCVATAYSYAEAGGLKTFLGDKTQVGYIAVDPKVIPLGSLLYVVLDNGYVYGYCEARDTGGLIKGPKIDLFLPSMADVKEFGRKNCKVYILRYGF